MNLYNNKQPQYHIASELAYLFKKDIEKPPKTEPDQWVIEMRDIHKKVMDLCEIYPQMRKKSSGQMNQPQQQQQQTFASNNSKRKLTLTLRTKK
jgi:hypothetical protein